MFPTVLNSTIVAFVSTKRFVRFLNSNEAHPNAFLKTQNSDGDNKVPDQKSVDVYLKDTSFFWDDGLVSKAIDLGQNGISEVVIKRGELVMIAGPVFLNIFKIYLQSLLI